MRKRKGPSLVCQHLENISRAALEKYQHIVRGYVRKQHGIYALYRRGRLYYVGLASNLCGRLNSHLRDRHGQSWDRFAVYLTGDNPHMKELESLVLRIVRPPGNRVAGKFAQAENLYRRFSREMKEHALRELADLLGRRRPRVHIRSGGKSRASRARPDLHGCFARATTLERVCKGKRLRARVHKDGMIQYKGKKFRSVSRAATAAAGRPRNGWAFWRVKNRAGQWVTLRDWVGK
ncbi:MAG: DUF2924 domain-containing protein [Phycisphaerae bacterium]|nr:DUF2924 domain-containing protein [Phycisphaerae bacterium]